MVRRVEQHADGFFVAFDEDRMLPAAFSTQYAAWAAFNVPRETLSMLQLFANMRVGGVIGKVFMFDLVHHIK